MYIKKSIFVLLVLGMLVAIPASAATTAECASLSRSLRVGMTGGDIKILQQILNQDVRTRVAESGIGAQGQESTYFGAKTKLAVIKFQNIYAKEVLTPAGLTMGSGFVGIFSRAKLTTLCMASISTVTTNSSSSRPPRQTINAPAVASSTPPTTTGVVIPATPPKASPPAVANSTLTPLPVSIFGSFAYSENDPLEFHYPSEYTVSPGAKLSITGSGFSKTANTVHIGALTLSATSSNFTSLEIAIPATATKGKFEFWVSNNKGASNKKFLVITDASTTPPKIVSHTPVSGLLGTTVVITGTEFTPTNNDVYTSNAIISNMSSTDGKTLSFQVNANDIPGAIAGLDVPNIDAQFPIWFFVVNERGVSNSSMFTLKI